MLAIIIEQLMYKRLYIILEMLSVIYDVQVGLRQKYSTSKVPINLTDKIRE